MRRADTAGVEGGAGSSILTPQKGIYPMTVRHVCVSRGQSIREGDRLAQLLEPSGRWVTLVVSNCAGSVKAMRLHEGDVIHGPSEVATVDLHRRVVGELSRVERMSLEDLLEEEANQALTAPAPLRPITERKRPHSAPRDTGPKGMRAFLGQYKLAVAALIAAALIPLGGYVGMKLYDRVMEQPDVTMNALWEEMMASRAATREATDPHRMRSMSDRAASNLEAIRTATAIREGARVANTCDGLYVGKEMPGLHVSKGIRRLIYVDPQRGIGSFIWSKAQTVESFACAEFE